MKTLLDNLTPEQQLQLLYTQNRFGNTALHDAALRGLTETVKTLLDIITPVQQLQLLSLQNKNDRTAHMSSVHLETTTILEQYYKEAESIIYREFVKNTE